MGKKRNKSKQGQCVFCGGIGLTKEHIWSDWLRSILPTKQDHGQMRLFAKHGEPKDPEVARRDGAMNQRKIRNVCKQCNNGWMHDLVDLAKPFAEALILDKPITLEKKSQKYLAGWIAISTIMAEFTDHETAVITPFERSLLMASHAPSENWTILLGRYSGEEWGVIRYEHHSAAFNVNALSGPPTGGYALPETVQVTTYTLGSLVVHAFTSTSRSIAIAGRKFILSRELTPIWPPVFNSIAWPATKLLCDVDMRDIAGGFMESLSPAPWDL